MFLNNLILNKMLLILFSFHVCADIYAYIAYKILPDIPNERFIYRWFKNPSPSRPLMCGRCRAAIFVAPHPALSAEPPAVLHLPALSRPLATLPSTAMTTLDLAARIGANPAKFFFNAAKTLQTPARAYDDIGYQQFRADIFRIHVYVILSTWHYF